MIYLKKTGVFYDNNLNPEHEDFREMEVKSIIPYLNEIINIDNDFTLRDFFYVVEREEVVMNVLFSSSLGHHSLRPFLDEIEKECIPESKEELSHIECIWVAEQFNYKIFYEKHKDDEDGLFKQLGGLREPDGDEKNEIDIYIDVSGVGKDTEDMTGYAIEYTPLYRLEHLPIKLNKKFQIRDVNKMGHNENNVVEGVREFSVFEVFSALLSEISFAGFPDERDQTLKETIDIAEKNKRKQEGE